MREVILSQRDIGRIKTLQNIKVSKGNWCKVCKKRFKTNALLNEKGICVSCIEKILERDKK